MNQINTCTSDFQDLIESESVYVDKTAYMHRLISGKPIWLVGLSFDRETRKLVDCAAAPFTP